MEIKDTKEQIEFVEFQLEKNKSNLEDCKRIYTKRLDKLKKDFETDKEELTQKGVELKEKLKELKKKLKEEKKTQNGN